jgi:hypothetical protein
MNRPYAPRPIAAIVSAVESILLLRKSPMRIPISGAMPSHRPKMKEVFIDRRRVGLSPQSTTDMRKLSRLRVKPSDMSANIVPGTIGSTARDLPRLQRAVTDRVGFSR